MRFFLLLARRLIPTPLTLIMLALWIALALISTHIIGAFLIPKLDSTEQVLALSLGLTFGLPILVAPRPTWEPAGWGIALSLLALLILGMLARSTTTALQTHGNWAINWTRQKQAPAKLQDLAVKVTQTSRWLATLVPIEQLEQEFGVSEREVTWKLDLNDKKPVGPQITGEDVSKQLKQQIADATDKRLIERDLRSPDPETIRKLNLRLREVLNLERTQRGQTSLLIREDLNRVAQQHCIAMRDQGFFSHIDPQGKGPKDRAEKELLPRTDIVELIGKVDNSDDVARALVNGFVKNPSDRNDLLSTDREYQAMGTGIACNGPTCYCTVIFL